MYMVNMKCKRVIAVVLLAVTVVAAQELSAQDQEVQKNTADNTSHSADVEERRLGHHHLLPLYGGLLGLGGLGGLGGLNALAVLFAIKVKIVVVATLIALAIFHYSKYFKKGCETIFPYDGYSNHGPPTGYSNHGPSGPSDFSSYTGPDPYSAYSSLHPDISSISEYQHHATGFEDHHDHDHHHDHDDHSFGDSHGYESHPNFNGHDQFSIDDASAGPPGISPSASSVNPADGTAVPAIEKSSPYRRISIQKRQLNQNLLQSINWGEIAFQFLGVDTVGCRRRFVCELDFRSRRNPITRMAFGLIGRDFLDRYRDLSADGKKPAKYEDCARMYRECAAAGKYDTNDTDDDEDDEEVNTDDSITEKDVDDVLNEVTEPTRNTVDDAPEEESNRNLYISQLAQIILKRSD